MFKNLTSVFIFMLITFSLNFFEFQSTKGSSIKYLQFIYLFTAVILSIPYIFPKREGFVLPVQLISFSILLSIFVSNITWGQSFSDSLAGTILSLVWFFFFYLKHIKFPIEKIEKLVIVYGIIYLILYFFQFTHPNTNYFVPLDAIGDTNRGITRFIFPGSGVFYLTSFIAINKFKININKRIFWAFLSIMGVVVTIMQVSRIAILAVFIIYSYHFLKGQELYKKLVLIGCLTGLIFFIYQSNNQIINGLKDTQNQTKEEGVDYIRIRSGTFFLTNFSLTNVNRILGNGVPYGETSEYNKHYAYYISNYGYWLSDVGIIAVYSMFGIFAVLGYILIWVKSFITTVPEKYFYLKYYLWYLLITFLTTDNIYGPANLITIVFTIYIYQIVYEREKINLHILEYISKT